MATRLLPRPLSPTDASPAAVARAAGERVIELSQCVPPHARENHWSASHTSTGHATLPLCAGLHSDAAGRETAPFALSVSSDSYRQSLLHSAKAVRDQAAATAAHQSPHVSWDGRSVFATPDAPLLSLSDLSRLSDALLCNTSLTCLDFGRSLPSGSMPLLNVLLQQHPSLVSINLAGNALGAGGADTEALRALCATLASPLSLPHLATLDLAHNQFTPRCLEIVCTTVLRSAPSLQSLDWRGNEVGLRGGWAIVDALRLRAEASSGPLAPVTSLLLECSEDGLDGAPAAAVDSASGGLPPHPNLATTLASSKPRPAYWARIQQLLRENRQRADQTLLEHQRAQDRTAAHEKHEEHKEAVVAAVTASKLPPLSASSSSSSIAAGETYARVAEGTAARHAPTSKLHPTIVPAGPASGSSPSAAVVGSDASPPSFIPPALFHASLGRLVSELNQERATRFERQEQLSASVQREERLQNQLHEMEASARAAARKIEELQSTVSKGAAHIRDLEGSLLAQKTKESLMVSSHAAQLASLDSRAQADSAELVRVNADLSRLRHEVTEERGRTRAALRASAEMAADRNRGLGMQSAGLRELERRVEQLRWERTHAGAATADLTPSDHSAGTSTGAGASTPPRQQQHHSPQAHHTYTESGSHKLPPRPTSSGSSSAAAAASYVLPAASGFKSSLNLKPTPLSLSPGSVATSAASSSAAAAASSPSTGLGDHRSPRSGLSISVAQAQASPASHHQLRPASSPSPGPGSAPISPRSPASPSASPMGGGGGSVGRGANPALSPSLSMFSSTAPPLPPEVLSPQHGLQLMPHHLPTWQQPPPEHKTLKLKPKQRGP